MNSNEPTASNTRGFTLMEVIVSVAIFAMMFGLVFMLLNTTRTLTRTGETQTDLQEYARICVEKVSNDLKLCGRMTGTNGLQYPRWGNFSNVPSTTIVGGHRLYAPFGTGGNGVPGAYGAGYFAHNPPTVAQRVGTLPEWLESSREMIYVLPSTNIPPLKDVTDPVTGVITKQIDWSTDEYALIVARDPLTGINQLLRLCHSTGPNGDTTDVIANYVDRFVVEDTGGKPDGDGITLNTTSQSGLSDSQLRIIIWFAKPVLETTNTVLLTKYVTTIGMRNNLVAAN